MKQPDAVAMNNAVYRAMKPELEKLYPAHQYVAFTEGRVCGDASDFDQLVEILKVKNVDPDRSMIVQVGENLPDFIEMVLC